jgi:hypothetical protein
MTKRYDFAFRPFVPSPGVNDSSFDMHAAVENLDPVLPATLAEKFTHCPDGYPNDEHIILGATAAHHAVSDEKIMLAVREGEASAVCYHDVANLTARSWVGLFNKVHLSNDVVLQVVQIEKLEDDRYGEEVTIRHFTRDGLVSSGTFSDPNHSQYPLWVADKLLLECAELY